MYVHASTVYMPTKCVTNSDIPTLRAHLQLQSAINAATEGATNREFRFSMLNPLPLH